MNKKTQTLKKYFKDKKSYKIPTCHDPLSIKLIEKTAKLKVIKVISI